MEKHQESERQSAWPETVLVNSSIVEMDWEQFKRDRKCECAWCRSASWIFLLIMDAIVFLMDAFAVSYNVINQ